MVTSTPPRSDSVGIGRAALAATEWFPGHAGPDPPTHMLWAGGFVARCRQLLSAMTTLVEQDEDDAVGALYRPLLETYLSGVFVLLGGDEAVKVLGRALLDTTHGLDVAFGRAQREDRPDEAERLAVSDYKGKTGLVERVDQLLAEQDAAYRGWSTRIHRNHYRVLSLYDAHGGAGCLHRHLITSPDGATVVHGARGTPEIAILYLHNAIALVIGLAGLWGNQAGQDVSELVDVERRWQEMQPDEWDASAAAT